MTEVKRTVLLISVGGTGAPVIYSLNNQQPDYIIYFTSRDSRRVVRQEVEPALEFRPVDHDMIVTDDEQNLLASVRILLQQLPRLLANWNLDYSTLQGDYTGGTKTMSAALVLCLAKKGCPYSYIGGTSRDKDNLGVVIDGKEQMLYRKNPWDELAIEDLHEIRLMFNRCRFRVVEEMSQQTAERVVENRAFFVGLQYVAAGFYKWDNFDYKGALSQLKRGLNTLSPFIQGHSDRELKRFVQQLATEQERLEQILRDMLLFKPQPSKKDQQLLGGNIDGQAFVVDLLANAVRRAEIEYKYDDAVARLYSVIEKIAKVRLLTVYDLDNSDLDLDKVPEALHQELREHYFSGFVGKIQIPLGRSYALLKSFDDPLGVAYQESIEDLEKVLGIRNMSLLAHGFEPVTEETYTKLLQIALKFTRIDNSDLPAFPQLPHGIEFL